MVWPGRGSHPTTGGILLSALPNATVPSTLWKAKIITRSRDDKPIKNPVQYNCQIHMTIRCHSCQKELSNETTFPQVPLLLTLGLFRQWRRHDMDTVLSEPSVTSWRRPARPGAEVSVPLQIQAERYAAQIEDLVAAGLSDTAGRWRRSLKKAWPSRTSG